MRKVKVLLIANITYIFCTKTEAQSYYRLTWFSSLSSLLLVLVRIMRYACARVCMFVLLHEWVLLCQEHVLDEAFMYLAPKYYKKIIRKVVSCSCSIDGLESQVLYFPHLLVVDTAWVQPWPTPSGALTIPCTSSNPRIWWSWWMLLWRGSRGNAATSWFTCCKSCLTHATVYGQVKLNIN